MQNPKSLIITIKMSDILSDSGIIAILAAHKEADRLVVDELTVSCRALGRNLENVMLPKLLQIAQKQLSTNSVVQINYKQGPRNTPALEWLANISREKVSKEGTIQYYIPEIINTNGLKIEVKDASKIQV